MHNVVLKSQSTEGPTMHAYVRYIFTLACFQKRRPRSHCPRLSYILLGQLLIETTWTIAAARLLLLLLLRLRLRLLFFIWRRLC